MLSGNLVTKAAVNVGAATGDNVAMRLMWYEDLGV